MRKLIFFFIFTTLAIAENKEERVLREMAKHKELICNAAHSFGIEPRIIASVIYAERFLNYNWEDDLFDVLFAETGYNSSIGFAQIKVATAFWIEQELNNFHGFYFLTVNIKQFFSRSKSKKELIERLVNDSTNIYYCAAYLSMIKHRWEKIFLFQSNNEAGILATLYSLGIIKFDGAERVPHANPQMNFLGEIAQKFYSGFLLRDIFE